MFPLNSKLLFVTLTIILKMGNMNISKDYKMLWHMFSVPFDFASGDKLPILKNGLNIIIIEKIVDEKETLSILNPPRSDHYSKNKNTIILFKFNDYFEPIVLRSVIGGHNQGGFKEVFIKNFRFDIVYLIINLTG